MAQDKAFDEWFDVLKRVAAEHYNFEEEALDSMDPVAWYPAYEDGLTPEQAMAADVKEA